LIESSLLDKSLKGQAKLKDIKKFRKTGKKSISIEKTLSKKNFKSLHIQGETIKMYEKMFWDSYLDCNAKTYTTLISAKETDYKKGNSIILFATEEYLRSNVMQILKFLPLITHLIDMGMQ